MRLLKWAFYLTLALVVVVVVIGFFLPSTVQVERTRTLAVPLETVWSHVEDLRAWPAWSPWDGLDPETIHEYVGGSTGVGARDIATSSSEALGRTALEITAVDPGRGLEYALSELPAEGPDAQPIGTGYLRLAEVEGGTRVTWGDHIELGRNYIARAFLPLSVDGRLGPLFEKGLENLQRVAESGKWKPPAPDTKSAVLKDKQ